MFARCRYNYRFITYGKVRIQGGQVLKGDVVIFGAKNAALPILFATLLTDEEITLTNVPRLRDIDTTLELLEILGKKVTVIETVVITGGQSS